ncbi:acyltransferase [Halobacteria archaeon HArc-gm2]|nr:acyltransferase [Halobacteria archaeon HArc-gm2]
MALLGVQFAIFYARNPLFPSLTTELLSQHGAEIGEGARIKRTFYIDNAVNDQNSAGDFSHLTVGSNTYIGDQVYVDLADEVRIGEDVTVGGQTSFVTHADCNRSPWIAKQYPREQGPVIVEPGSWIGFGSSIMHNVTVAEESLVASGAVLRDDTEGRTVYGGVPAEKIGEI